MIINYQINWKTKQEIYCLKHVLKQFGNDIIILYQQENKEITHLFLRVDFSNEILINNWFSCIIEQCCSACCAASDSKKTVFKKFKFNLSKTFFTYSDIFKW